MLARVVGGRVAAALVAVGLLVFVDLKSKDWAASELRQRGPRTVAGGHVRLKYQENAGIAFGLLRDGSRKTAILTYSAISAVVLLAVLLHRLLRRRAAGWLTSAGCAALLAGTLGNLVDRLLRGYVVDFIDLTARQRLRWPTFNVADILIAVGMGLCAVGLARSARRRPARPAALV
jgi:lipoprotein signal peptidase